MSRFIFGCVCLTMIFTLGACGGGQANQPATNGAQTGDCGGDAGGDTGADTGGDTGSDSGGDTGEDGPKEDPYKYRKIKADAPEGWHNLVKDGVAELHKADYGILKEVDKYEMLAKFSELETPHLSSGTDEEWDEWREATSAVFIYNVTKTEDAPVATLEELGGDFIDGFDKSAVREVQGAAVYVHPDDETKWLACVSNANGTYVLTALVRSDAASDVLKPYPMTIEAE